MLDNRFESEIVLWKYKRLKVRLL